MKKLALLASGATLALSSTLALAGGPEDLLPPAFRNQPSPTPTQTATPTPTPSANTTSVPVIQEIPGSGGSGTSSRPAPPRTQLPPGFPSLRELESMEPDEINAALGLRPKFDIPPAARRSMEQVGVLSQTEGGFASGSLSSQPAALVRAALSASDGQLVSRWGHILVRRALASRLDAPRGMGPTEFTALRARALGAMGEPVVARALVQDVDGSNYDRMLTDAAFDAYLSSGDILGLCPVARLQTELRDDGEWDMLQAICLAYLGETRSAERRLQRTLGRGDAEEIDVRLAQRYAGAAGEGDRAVNIEWDGVEALTPWRFAMARALGAELPDALRDDAGARYDISDVLIPGTPLLERVEAADRAGARGVISSAAMIDLYSMLYASEAYPQEAKTTAQLLREAYVADEVTDRVAAIRQLWGDDGDYGRRVLTAYAAARLPVNDALQADAASIIASMLAAGLDRNALRWGNVVVEGSEAWALLALAQPESNAVVDEGAVGDFIDEDDSTGNRKAAFLVAGLAGLGRMDADDLADYGDDLGVNYTRRSPWSIRIGQAAELENAALVSILAGVGMQGTRWDRMTPRHLYHIVSALNAVGLTAEARMIAAEAVARG